MATHITRVLAVAFLTASSVAFSAAANAKPVVEVVFVLDTTGSMGPLIEGAKRKIWSIATSIIDCSPDAEIRMGLVAYRDIGDEYVTKTFNLTTDIQDLYGNLLALRARGGGDWPESVNEALYVATTKVEWSYGPDTTRIMFLVGDAPPHMDYAQDKKYPEVLEIARKKGILVNTVQAGTARDTERVWRSVAQLGQGEYVAIPQDGGHVVVIETPYDTEIIELQRMIHGTVVPYGSRESQERTTRKMDIAKAAPAPVASDMATYMAKRRVASAAPAEALTGDGDLVADLLAGRQKLETLKDEELPDAVRTLKGAERKAFIEKQAAERKKLNERMAELVKKRDAFVLEKRKSAPPKTGDSFDVAVEGMLKAQIKQ